MAWVSLNNLIDKYFNKVFTLLASIAFFKGNVKIINAGFLKISESITHCDNAGFLSGVTDRAFNKRNKTLKY